MPKGIILMTAMPPSKGHLHLMNFAANYPGITDVRVILCTRSIEPIPGWMRLDALKSHAKDMMGTALVTVNQFEDDNAPQNPTESENSGDFWKYWVNVINATIGNVRSDDVVFASDLYGRDLANWLGCTFVPCNIYREVVPISATEIRKEPFENFHYIAPEFQKMMRRTFTFFGPESTGKTTVSKLAATLLNGHWVPEYAREYLEIQHSPEVTLDRMRAIQNGQYALECAASQLVDKPFIFRDTDLLSTVGYYHIMERQQNVKFTREIDDCLEKWEQSAPHSYILMNDRIPFVLDKLRFGQDERESTNDFWMQLLYKHEQRFYVVKSVDIADQIEEIHKFVMDDFQLVWNDITKFVRT